MEWKRSLQSSNSYGRHGSHEAGAHAAPSHSHAPAAHSHAAPARAPRPRRGRRLGLLIGLAAGVILAGSALFFVFSHVFSVHYLLPGGSQKTELVFKGHLPARVPEATWEGFTLVGWEDESGRLVAAPAEPVEEDRVYTARMMPTLRSDGHEPYLFPDENGFLLPDSGLSRGEAAVIIESFMAVRVAAEGNYADIPLDAPYATAAAVLKTLDVVPGDSFRPEEDITLRELGSMLSQFYPVTQRREISAYPADAEPDEPATRAQCAYVINRALGRGEGLEPEAPFTGKTPDLRPDHPLYADMLEAAVPHSFSLSGGQERWQSAEAFSRELEPGLMFIGTQMYAVDEEGYLIKNASWEGFDFGYDGRFTSGMPELDELVQQALGEIITPDMSEEEKLRAAYDYTVHSFTYVKGKVYNRGDISWSEEEAYEMLSTGYNNCYGYAAVFYQLARALGRDAILISGFYGSNYLPHAWVEFMEGDTRYICDAEVEMTYHRAELEAPDMFMMTTAFARTWKYTR